MEDDMSDMDFAKIVVKKKEAEQSRAEQREAIIQEGIDAIPNESVVKFLNFGSSNIIKDAMAKMIHSTRLEQGGIDIINSPSVESVQRELVHSLNQSIRSTRHDYVDGGLNYDLFLTQAKNAFETCSVDFPKLGGIREVAEQIAKEVAEAAKIVAEKHNYNACDALINGKVASR